MADKALGATYIEIGATTDKLKTQLNQAKTEVERAALKSEALFKATSLRFNDSMARKSLSEIEASVVRLRAHLEKQMTLNAPLYKLEALQSSITKAETALARFRKESDSMPGIMNKMTAGTNSMNQAMGQLGFLVGDADMFMLNFSTGIRSIANNAPMVVQGLMYAKKAAQETGQSFKSALVGSLMGPGGVMLAINALMFALNVLPQLFAKSDKAVEEHKEKLKSLREEYQKLTREQITNYLSELDKQLADLEKKYPTQKTQTITKVVGGNAVSESVTVGVKGGDRFGGEWGTVQDIESRKQALKETLRDLGVIENVSNRLTLNQEKLNKLNSNPESPFYFKNIVKTAKSYEEAKAVVEQWIKADEERSKKKGGGETPEKDRENDLKQYYDKVKWYDADYNDYLKTQLDKEIADLSNTIKDEVKLQEYKVKRQKEIATDFWKWVEDNKPGLIEKNGLGLDDVSIMNTPRGRKNAQGVYLNDTTMMPIDSEQVRKQKDQSDTGFKNSMKDFEDYKSSVESFSNTLSSGFANAIISGENLGDMFKNLAAQLAGMVIQASLFKIIMSAFDLGSGGAASAIGAIVSGVSNSLSAPLGATGGAIPQSLTNNSFNVNNQFSLSTSGIISGLAKVQNSVDRMTGSLQAMNVNVMSQKPVVVKNYLDGKPMAENSAKHIKQFNESNVQI